MKDWRHAIGVLSDTVVFVMGRAPDKFPIEDYLPADKQMTLERAFKEMRAEFQSFADAFGEAAEIDECRVAIDESYSLYCAGDSIAGGKRLEQLYHHLLRFQKEKK
jgi:hypothetical protein